MDPKTSKTMEFELISVQETWSAMENLVEKGLARYLLSVSYIIFIS